MLDTSYLVAASVLAQTLLLGRILLFGIWRSSRAICWLLVWGIASSLADLLLYQDSAGPPYLWRVGDQFITLLLFALAVRSMTNRMVEAYEGIHRLVHKFFRLLTFIAIMLLASIVMSAYLGDASKFAGALYSSDLVFETFLMLSWAILLGFSIWLRITPSRNGLIHGTCLALYLGVDCMRSIMSEQATKPLAIAAEAAIFSVWAILISRPGERPRHPQAR